MANEKTAKTAKTETNLPEAAPAPEFKFRVKRQVTLPLLKPEVDKPIFIKITSDIFLGKEIKGSGEKATMEPAHLVNCINLETGEECQLIVAAVLMGIFEDEYAGNSYVGCSFRIVKGAKKDGKRYHPYSISEIEV